MTNIRALRLRTIVLAAATLFLLTEPTAARQVQLAQAGSNCGAFVRVQPGDTLYAIARRCGVSLGDLLRANPDIDPRDIAIGARLRTSDEPDDRDERAGSRLSISISPQRGPAGSDISVSAEGFPPFAPVEVGGGSSRNDFRALQRGRANSRGRVRTTLTVPEANRRDDDFAVVVQTLDSRLRVRSTPFRIVSAGPPPRNRDRDERDRSDRRNDSVTITGMLTSEGVECQAMRSIDGKLYTLAGDTKRLGPGAPVQVTGKIARVSICQQGTTIEVRRISQR